MELHPDKNIGDDEKEKERKADLFKKVRRALEILGDEEKRAKYDEFAKVFGK